MILPTIIRTHTGAEYDRQPLDNTGIKSFLNEQDAMTYSELPGWLDDCFSGACGQVGGTSRIHPARIYGLCRSLNEISPSSVAQAMNRRREAMGEAGYSDSYCRKIASACRCASQAIKHHRLFWEAETIPAQVETRATPYTAEEMRRLKLLSLLSFNEMSLYEAELKKKYRTA